MKLTIFAERTNGVKEFYKQVKAEGYVGTVKAVRLDKIAAGSTPGYAIRLRGNFRDCIFVLRKSWKGFPTNIVIGWPCKVEGKS